MGRQANSERVEGSMNQVYLLNGPNLGMLGERQPEIYGSTTLAEIERVSTARAEERSLAIECFQSDSEAELIGLIHKAARAGAAVIINPGAFTHYSYAIADALAMVSGPVIEVHISNPHAREAYRAKSVVSPVATGCIAGLGAGGYELAVEAVARIVAAGQRDPGV